MSKEQRKCKRYRPRPELRAALKSDGSALLEIKNIGCDGMAVEYDPDSSTLPCVLELNLYDWEHPGVVVENLRCGKIYDITELSDGKTRSGGKKRLRGMRFLNLKASQLNRIFRILEKLGRTERFREKDG